ncbi:sorbosone dehydrogenase family protein [Xanthomonas rydalmerensis]|uniref:Sorbosone dehydrogenase family protein n=1 Tax=Xanthomonas rydalmerensis TaxID=3046274 RepID=A0ABZ0JKS0_9XANT|nr:sorbosone dehydrogenase family protein [Xanthomonas sp. DM-2023]WOS40401.1 sorbosone dehydrogenase family protein [Xanthomonas sp. DM-2023]WOS44585.1 sorbosone dehydrogenase family protein [Xanthomonas sp. DM-2023]WOS48765.1 sorbosone dehydrogenase family protein [Xanthomonas sp. DM-2023]WOS52945.1 sorbosone dehydrogenase family protein [Xanthomonas sp. DM-2023]WOS57129.1 sorbosone dehydrogenase family protein [Xanthomonas sp. DM-2023]
MTMSSPIRARWVLCALSAALLAACGDTAKHPIEDGMGPNPVLPDPVKRMIPTVKVAEVKRWADGAAPVPAADLAVQAFARDLDHPRWLYVLPNGDVLVAETAEPPAPEKESSGLRDKIQGAMMSKAGASVPSANRITLLRDADGDGVAEVRTQFLKGLYSPFGMALVGDRLYIANADALVSFPYKDGDTQITAAPSFVANLPGGINHHWTKSLLASRDGKKLYVGVGSNSNVAENGMEQELNRAAILEVDAASGATRVFASGLRNPVGLAWQPGTDTLWTVVNERDELGSDLVPDYLTSVREGGFYGWPYSYYGQHVDERVQPQNPEMVASAIKPDYALGAHTASLGLAFYEGALLPQTYRGGAFIGQHGSWNRDPPSGYKVIYVPFANGKPSGKPQDVLTGFLDAEGHAQGRPVGVAVDKPGALLVADDVGNVIWRVTPKPGK